MHRRYTEQHAQTFTEIDRHVFYYYPIQLVGNLGIEPSIPEVPDLQSGAVANAAHCPFKTLGTATGSRTLLYGMKTRCPNR